MVKDLIKQLADRAGKTIFICSHIMSLIEELCDRIGIINHGRLIAVGTIEEIMTQTDTRSLEDAFIALTGGMEEQELLAWRNHSVTS
jgi:ABC-2 type transport system ATP-binding protein